MTPGSLHQISSPHHPPPDLCLRTTALLPTPPPRPPLTLIGCLVTNWAARIGFRPKETQSWTEDGCGLPKRCCQGRGGEKYQLYHMIIIQNKCKRKQKSQIPLILLKTLNSVTTNAHFAMFAVSEQLGLYHYILDTWSAVDVDTAGTTSRERTKCEGRT